ncbi:MAG: hypothetical protein ACM3QZ_00395 [Solirubrobacterales bacterium]
MVCNRGAISRLLAAAVVMTLLLGFGVIALAGGDSVTTSDTLSLVSAPDSDLFITGIFPSPAVSDNGLVYMTMGHRLVKQRGFAGRSPDVSKLLRSAYPLYRSMNDGRSWELVNLPNDFSISSTVAVKNIGFLPDGRTVVTVLKNDISRTFVSHDGIAWEDFDPKGVRLTLDSYWCSPLIRPSGVPRPSVDQLVGSTWTTLAGSQLKMATKGKKWDKTLMGGVKSYCVLGGKTLLVMDKKCELYRCSLDGTKKKVTGFQLKMGKISGSKTTLYPEIASVTTPDGGWAVVAFDYSEGANVYCSVSPSVNWYRADRRGLASKPGYPPTRIVRIGLAANGWLGVLDSQGRLFLSHDYGRHWSAPSNTSYDETKIAAVKLKILPLKNAALAVISGDGINQYMIYRFDAPASTAAAPKAPL